MSIAITLESLIPAATAADREPLAGTGITLTELFRRLKLVKPGIKSRPVPTPASRKCKRMVTELVFSGLELYAFKSLPVVKNNTGVSTELRTLTGDHTWHSLVVIYNNPMSEAVRRMGELDRELFVLIFDRLNRAAPTVDGRWCVTIETDSGSAVSQLQAMLEVCLQAVYDVRLPHILGLAIDSITAQEIVRILRSGNGDTIPGLVNLSSHRAKATKEWEAKLFAEREAWIAKRMAELDEEEKKEEAARELAEEQKLEEELARRRRLRELREQVAARSTHQAETGEEGRPSAP